MFAYVIKRLLSGVVVLFLISMSVFLLFWYGPSEPAQTICDNDTQNRCTPARLEVFRENLGFNNPWYDEYGNFMKGMVVGREIQFGSTTKFQCDAPCLGYSYRTKAPVFEEMKTRMPATFSVAFGGAFLYLAIGVPIGVAAARRRGTLATRHWCRASWCLVDPLLPLRTPHLALPHDQLGSAALRRDGLLPDPDNPAKWFSGMLLAVARPRGFGCTQYTRYARGSMVEVLGEDYIRTAKSKGLTANKVVYKHGLRAALVPVITIFGIDFGTLLAGTIFTERIFDIQGIGLWSLQAVFQRDLPVVAATALFGATVLIISNIVVDVVYSVLDPRVRLS